MDVQTDFPLFEAVDAAILEVASRYPSLVGLAEIWQTLDERERAVFEQVLVKQLQMKTNSERIRTLSDILAYHHGLALHYGQMSEYFERQKTHRTITLAGVNRLIANHEKQRAQQLADIIRNGGEGDIARIYAKRFF